MTEPKLSEEEVLALLSGRKPVTYITKLESYALRRRWMTVAWLLGASYREIGMLEGISHASVFQAVKKELTEAERRGRLASSLELTALSWYRDKFQEFRSVVVLGTPLSSADWLRTMHPFPGD